MRCITISKQSKRLVLGDVVIMELLSEFSLILDVIVLDNTVLVEDGLKRLFDVSLLLHLLKC
jgi:hypothetical protein